MTIVHGALLCVAVGFIVLAVLAGVRRHIGAHWYQVGVQISVFLIVLNGLIFVFFAVVAIFDGASS